MSMLAGALDWNQSKQGGKAGFGATGGAGVYRQPGLLLWSGDAQDLATSPSGNVCTWDGDLHLDGGSTSICSPLGPASIALDAYERGGAAALAGLIGDWSIAIWDAKRHTILLASDFAGVRPLYFRSTAAGVQWSSSLSDLVDRSQDCELDENYIGEFMTGGGAGCRTPYRGIEPAPAGGFARISAAGTERGEFWRLPTGPSRKYRDERDYGNHLFTVFQESVHCRMNATTPVCAELSGGLDSSSIVCMAHSLMSRRKVRSPKLITLSYRLPGSIDEQFIRSVEQQCGLAGIHLDLDGAAVLSEEALADASPGFWRPRFTNVKQQMELTGAHTLMTGQFGDLIMGNYQDATPAVLGYLTGGRPWSALREAFAWSGPLTMPVHHILGKAIGELIGRSKSIDVSGAGAHGEFARNILAPAFRRRFESSGPFRNPGADYLADVSPERRRLFQMVHQVLSTRVLQCPDALLGVNYTHPFAHRPLLEFMLSVPPRLTSRPKTPRRLMRQAFRELLPSAVLNRRSKASYHDAFLAACRPRAIEMLKRPSAIRLVELGYIDRSVLDSRLRRYVQGLECGQAQLRNIILLEFWLRHRGASEHPNLKIGSEEFSASQPA